MAYNTIGGFPAQQLRKSRKNWKRLCRNLGLSTDEISDPSRKYDNHVFLVYMHVNKINGKVYVGITHHINPYKRWGYSGNLYTHCVKFENAIHKYGWDNFNHIILCRTSKEKAIIIEKTLIAYYKKLGISYNIANGGEGAEAMTEETKKKLSEIMRANPKLRGRHHTDEARAKISEANKLRVYSEEHKAHLRKVAELGRKTMIERGWWHSEETRKRIAKNLSKPVIQLDKEGNFIKEFSSAVEADRYFSNGRGHHISDVCNGKRKTAYGYNWAYKEERRFV